MEHRHRCVYCGALWFCHQDCPLPGPSACAECREGLRRSPDTPLRVIALRDGSRMLDRLAEHAADGIRDSMRRYRRQ